MSWVRKRWIVSACKAASLCRTGSECRLLLECAADHAEGGPKGIAASPHRTARKELGRRLQGWEDPMGAIGSTLLSGRVRGLNHPRGSDHASPLSSTTRTR